MMKIPEHLKLRSNEGDIGEWCLVRYIKESERFEQPPIEGDFLCGPLGLSEDSPGCLGFGYNGIQLAILTFGTRQEAQAFLDSAIVEPAISKDVVERVSDQTLKVVAGKSVVYEGNDLLKIRAAYFEQVGRHKISEGVCPRPEICVKRSPEEEERLR